MQTGIFPNYIFMLCEKQFAELGNAFRDITTVVRIFPKSQTLSNLPKALFSANCLIYKKLHTKFRQKMHSLLLMYFFILFYICVVLVFDATSAVTGRPAIDKIIT